MSLVTAALEKLDADLAKCTEEVDALADGYVEWLVELKDQNVRLVQHSECASPASLSHAGPTRARLRSNARGEDMARGYLLRALPRTPFLRAYPIPIPRRDQEPDAQGSEVGAATAQEGEEDGAGGGSGGRGRTHEPRERRWAPGQSAVGTQGLEQTQQLEQLVRP